MSFSIKSNNKKMKNKYIKINLKIFFMTSCLIEYYQKFINFVYKCITHKIIFILNYLYLSFKIHSICFENGNT